MKTVIRFFFIALTGFVLWLLLTWSLGAQNVIAGAAAAVLSSFLLNSYLPRHPTKLLQIRRYWWFLKYIPFWFWECVKANLDVAYRILHPSLPIHPGIVRVSTALKSDMALTFLANSITLTPGTFTVDIVGDKLYVHWINISTRDVVKETEIIVGKFERYLKEIFE